LAAYVLDSSVAASWLLPDEHDPAALELLGQTGTDQISAPYLLLYEVRNLLITVARRGRLSAEDVEIQMRAFRRLPIKFQEPENENMIWVFAAKHQLTGYDATFLTLAAQTKLPLATFDGALRRGAAVENIRLIPEFV
jgi:predicted nucleic acid-binding protein